jgi:hypothetical protein
MTLSQQTMQPLFGTRRAFFHSKTPQQETHTDIIFSTDIQRLHHASL